MQLHLPTNWPWAEDDLRRTLENALRLLASVTFTATVEGERETPLLWVRSDEPFASAIKPSSRCRTHR